ncbi:MAG: hypothetical protein ACSHX3_08770 [Litorimonas sp.]
MTLSRDTLDANIVAGVSIDGFAGLLADRPNLFAATGVFVSPNDIADMKAQVAAIEAASALMAYQSAVLDRSESDLIQKQLATKSLFMGYDFHISEHGPQLIEVNTNAGGGFLAAALQDAVGRAAFTCGESQLENESVATQKMVDTFLKEWREAGRSGRPDVIAIIDAEPERQYLYPDMIMAQYHLEQFGIKTLIVDPKELAYLGGEVRYGSIRVDMIYNRLTDFDFSEPDNTVIRQALIDDAAVISPAPRHHAVFADKRNLIWLSDADLLYAWGLSDVHISALKSVPNTVAVTPTNAEALWAARKEYFFKPTAGFGGRATYRGAKLTKRVWGEILKGDYIAQAFIPPTMRAVTVDGEPVTLKYDLRLYTYAGETLLITARVYQGQTTNFRTDGGGFAVVYKC